MKLNLRIIIYDFGNNSYIEHKDFDCSISDKLRITLLYRKTHYDIVYDQMYFEKYQKYLCLYVSLTENMQNLMVGVPKLNKQLDNLEINKNKELLIKNYNPFKPPSNYESSIQCLKCGGNFIMHPDIIKFCLKCLDEEINDMLISKYFLFIDKAIQLHTEEMENSMMIVYKKSIIF